MNLEEPGWVIIVLIIFVGATGEIYTRMTKDSNSIIRAFGYLVGICSIIFVFNFVLSKFLGVNLF